MTSLPGVALHLMHIPVFFNLRRSIQRRVKRSSQQGKSLTRHECLLSTRWIFARHDDSLVNYHHDVGAGGRYKYCTIGGGKRLAVQYLNFLLVPLVVTRDHG